MKILFANPAYREKLHNGLERYFFAAGSRCPWSLIKLQDALPRYSMFPFFMGYAAAILEQNGYSVEAIDAVPLNLSQEEFVKQCIAQQPELIVFETSTTTINYIRYLSGILKKMTQAIIVFTGSHVTALPEETISSTDHLDYIIRGEYEFALLELVKSLTKEKSLISIPGIVFRNGDKGIYTNPKAVIDDINKLPLPARHLFPTGKVKNMGLYYDGFCQNRPAIQMHSSRGCPFRCAFCLWTQVMYRQGVYRIFSPQRVVEEMIQLRDTFKAKEIYFDDDTFTGSKKHVLEICQTITEKKINIPWSAMGDVMVTDREMIYAMKKAGCIGLKFGLESAVPDVLKKINKPINLNKLTDLVRLCNKLRIKTHVSVSYGHFGETPETMEETFRFVARLPVDSVQFSIATPYPGTSFYTEALEKGILSHQEWEDYDPTHNSIISHPGLSPEILKKAEATSHGRWLKHKLFDIKWLFRQLYFLKYILRNQGLKGLLLRIKRGKDIIFLKRFA